MAERVTKMSIKVDLQCSRCYRKIKKILCEFPQIRDQTYDEKQNKLLITAVCCSPEKIRQKIICKGGETVQSVEILPDKPKESEKKPEKPKEEEKPKDTKKPVMEVMVRVCCCPPCYGGYGGGPCYCGRRRPVMCDDGCGRPACDCRGGNRGYHVSRCDYFSEENATASIVM